MGINIKQKKDDALYAANKAKYRLEIGWYNHHTEQRLEIWRKNPKGFYNMVAYINSEDEYKDRVIQDIKEQQKSKKQKKEIIKEMEDEEDD